ncbi:MAG: bifunctional UDP-N-acetylglucosamine diphosphorylase/glucosamine-1-phosphate N-acetyltransferase GlmU [Pseudomonadales bacterium]|nr:bifunctional UDP-N-acetylglucosamine diphosphorylase/glucosamine-1-phosphate N-acetyltransferase GlmU [Pseudomonadales bacterium]
MKSKLPKVLQPLAAKPLLAHVLETAKALANSRTHVVIGHGADEVKSRFENTDVASWVMQTEQLGTGHAVDMAMPFIDNDSISLILYGDVPLVKKETLKALLEKVTANTMALLTVELVDSTGYGRIIRDENKNVVAIVEQKDANAEQLAVKEVNTGILAIKTAELKAYLPQLSNQNAQGEYYLTDIIAMSVANGVGVDALCINDDIEVQGVNDKQQLSALERAYQARQAEALMVAGVTLIDPARIDVRGTVSVGQDVSIDVNCIFQGEVILGDNVSIAANCIIGEIGKKVTIGNDVEIKANCIIEDAIIANACVIGPYARLRPATELAEGVKIGNFVETKKSKIGQGSKVNHLSYIGDALIGKDVNIGAGTITCNYDGVNKHQTIIEDNAFIGSNTSLVAPVKIGHTATVGAGSTVGLDVPANELAVTRAKQRNISGWTRPRKK